MLWIVRQSGETGNEMDNKLARQRSFSQLIDPESFCIICMRTFRIALLHGDFIRKRARAGMGVSSSLLRIPAGFLTGYWRFRKNLIRIEINSETNCGTKEQLCTSCYNWWYPLIESSFAKVYIRLKKPNCLSWSRIGFPKAVAYRRQWLIWRQSSARTPCRGA